MIFEKMFESRLFFTDKLIAMGARIILCDPHRAIIVGGNRLFGAEISSPDIRAGMALLLAALCAKGRASSTTSIRSTAATSGSRNGSTLSAPGSSARRIASPVRAADPIRSAEPASPRFVLGDPGRWPLVMGIVNVTPDSFSDGGALFRAGGGRGRRFRMEADGAAIVDIGGESTRPGSDLVPAGEEMRRVIPVIAARCATGARSPSRSTPGRRSSRARRSRPARTSSTTSRRCSYDPEMAGVVRDFGAAVILMHMRGEPQDDAAADPVRRSRGRGPRRAFREEGRGDRGGDRSVADPRRSRASASARPSSTTSRSSGAVESLRALGPVVVGASRKAFIGHLTGRDAGRPRMAGSLAAVAAAALHGAAIVRVHDVAETVDFLRVFAPVMGMGAMTGAFDWIARLEFGWRDAIDILLVALIIYGIIRLIRGRGRCRCRSAWRCSG